MKDANSEGMVAWRSKQLRTVDDFLAAVPKEARAVLADLRKTITATAPDAVEKISYHIPTFDYHGPLVGFSVSKKHCGLHLMSPAIAKAFKEELKPYNTTTATIHFTADKPLPAALVKKLVKARMRENESRSPK